MNDVSGETAPRTRLGWRAERRPAPGFAHVLGAGAGAFVVFAVVAFVAEAAGSDDPTGPGVVLDLLLAVVAFVVGFRATGPLRAAATTGSCSACRSSGCSRSSAVDPVTGAR